MVALFALLVALSRVAHADPRHAVIIYAEGDDAGLLATELAHDVPEGLTAQGGSSVAAALEKRKIKNKLGAPLGNTKDRAKVLEALAEVASQRDVAAVVVASSKKPAKGPRIVTVVIVKGGAHDPDVESTANDVNDRKALVGKSLAPLAATKLVAPAPWQAT